MSLTKKHIATAIKENTSLNKTNLKIKYHKQDAYISKKKSNSQINHTIKQTTSTYCFLVTNH